MPTPTFLFYAGEKRVVDGTDSTMMMWDAFPDDMATDSTIELVLANLDLNEPVLKLVSFDDGNPLKVILHTSRCRSWTGYR